MSAPLQLSASDLHDIAYALNDLAGIYKDHNVEIGSHGLISITHGNTVLSLRLVAVDDGYAYVIDDRIGD